MGFLINILKYTEESITDVTIPDNITYIGNETFQYCDNLKSITIPDGVFPEHTEIIYR